MAKVLDCEFELHSTITYTELSRLFFYKDSFENKITHEGWYAVKQRNQTQSKLRSQLQVK